MEKFTPNASWRRGTPLYKSDNRHSVPISEPELIAPFDIQEKTAWRYTLFVVHTMANIKNFFGFRKDFRFIFTENTSVCVDYTSKQTKQTVAICASRWTPLLAKMEKGLSLRW